MLFLGYFLDFSIIFIQNLVHFLLHVQFLDTNLLFYASMHQLMAFYHVIMVFKDNISQDLEYLHLYWLTYELIQAFHYISTPQYGQKLSFRCLYFPVAKLARLSFDTYLLFFRAVLSYVAKSPLNSSINWSHGS